MNEKKRALIHPGSRVRVRDPLLTGDDAWKTARLGTVAKIPKQDHGLQVLLDGATSPQFCLWADVDVEQKPRPQLLELPLASIHPSRWQYRRRWDPDALLELARSIQDHGLVDRLLVFHDEQGEYELIAGERRLRACLALALTRAEYAKSLPDAINVVCAADWWTTLAPGNLVALDETIAVELLSGAAADFREIVILENLQRADPTAIEEAEAFHLLITEEGYTQERLAARLGKSQPYISQRLGLLGLGAEVRATVEAAAISFSAARAIATVPEAAQAAMVRHVQDLQTKEGQSDATSRKVQSLAGQLRKFLDVGHWDPHAETLAPTVRNYLRMVSRVVGHLTSEQAARAVDLHSANSQYGKGENLLGKQPVSVAGDSRSLHQILCTLLGQEDNVDTIWKRTASAAGWTCDRCRWLDEPQPDHFLDYLCLRWWTAGRGKSDAVTTCANYLDFADPIVLPITNTLKVAADEAGMAEAVHYAASVGHYLQTIPDYIRLNELAYQAGVERKSAEEISRGQAHLAPLWAYWHAQDIGTAFDLDHFQAHFCQRCCRFKLDLIDKSPPLPPCHFADHPHVSKTWQGARTAAPDSGVLVRRDSLMVPRCTGYRLARLPELPGPHVVFPKAFRTSVLGWLAGILKRGEMGNSHNHTLASSLNWLPYPRGDDDKPDVDRLCRYVRDSWQNLGGDAGIARLLDVALSESSACGKYQEPITLMDPLTGEAEDWASFDFDFAAGKPRRSWDAKAADWPQPWLKKEAK